MMRRLPSRPRARHAALGAAVAALLALAPAVQAANYTVTPQQRATAKQVAEAGVPLSELAPDAPDSHTVVKGDTLWGISKLFLKTPWRWPELWGMNLDEIRNPNLIYPGQVLVLDKSNGRARLRLGDGSLNGTVKLSPRIRSDLVDAGPIAGVPLSLIQPFLNDAVVFDTNELENAPRIVAAPEDHVLLGRGDIAYVRGDLQGQSSFHIFRDPKPLRDPSTKEILGYEAAYVGAAQLEQRGSEAGTPDTDKPMPVPDTFRITDTRQEAGVGDKLAPATTEDVGGGYVPHAPNVPVNGQIVSIYGDGANAGQDNIVAINRGKHDGIERGYVLALWHDGGEMVDKTDASHTKIKLPNQRVGELFVFRVFDRVSYGLILRSVQPVTTGDHVSQP